MKKRVISILICLSLIINMLPLSIFAEKLNVPDTLNNSNTLKNIKTFKDVNKDDWFYDSVMYAVEKGIFSGTSDDTFSAKDPMTRGMYVTMLGRIANIDKDKSTKDKLFSDIKSDAYYTPYVIWATEKGITNGIGENKFGPDILITREQMATFTVRFFDAYGIEYPKTIAKPAPVDFDKINDYAKSAVLKLWNSGLLEGDQNGYFNPKKNANRAEGATFAVRIDKSILDLEKVNEPKIETPKPNKEIPEPDDSDIEFLKYYNIKYNSNGGSEIGTQRILKGSPLKNLPTPYKENEIFSGWYYDSKLENLVLSKDVLNNDITLYAKYSSVAPLVETETPSFASALDQGTNFSIQVASLNTMTNEEVKEAIECNNLSSKDKSNLIQVIGDGRIFNISGLGGFEEGATYKLTLEDEDLYFQGLDNSVRNYNFTIAKEEVLNLSLNQDLVYIPFDKITNITQDGKDVEKVSSTLAKISNNSNSTLSDFTKGTFEYGNPLNVGDTITIYKGIRPDERILNDTREGADGEIVYLEITAVSGNVYSYKNAEIEDVLFKPDVLPISNLSDTDGDPLNNSITVDKAVLEFTDDIYIPMQLDSQTTVDIGDYLAFYEGEFGVNTNVIAYGYITSIKNENGTMIIAYTDATMDEIISAMDMYATDSVNGDTLLEDQDIEALEENIEEQARNSGFADEAAIYLADLALKTDSFTKLSDDFKMTDFQLLSEDGKPINPEEIRLMASGSKVEVELSTLKATISTKLKHFDTTGVRLTLDVGVEITITVSEDIQIVITVTGSFEEEVSISINVDGGAKWKWWGPFPYIAEYEATANIDLYNFTGVGINATIVTKEKKDNKWTEDKELQNISEELKKLLDAKDKYIGDGEETVADGLNDKYKAMLENESDWVKLFEKELFSAEIKIPPSLGILVIEISGNFIITANMNISLGCDFYYENAKRYIYTVQVFAKNVTSDVIDIREEHYEFTFYVMGTMGLRAGIKVEIAIGIISTKIGSVGFSAEFGVYARVWGYFYYQLEYTASKGRSSSYSGALLFELGIYLEILFVAQAFAETFSYELELFAEEWPLWSAGMRENVQDFGYEETDEFTLKKYIRELTIPDDLFNMTYMDLKTGDVDQKVYDDAKHFTIQITNNAFSYDAANNKLSVEPDKGDFIEEGDMIITWAGAPLAFTSAPITRTFGLYWDNLNNGYTIVFNTNGGSSVPMILNRFNATIEKPTQPTKKGYNFDGWYKDIEYKVKYVIPELMPNTDIVVYAKWVPRDDTEYKVEHYLQNDKNTLYTIVENDTQILYGTTDSIISPVAKAYAGFITPKSQELKILPDGSSILKYYYARGSYTASFDPGQAGGEATIYKYKFGKPIVAPQINMTGYTFKSWDKEVPETMPAEDMSFIAQWSEAEDISYRLEHYVQNANGNGYALTQIERKSGTTNQEININDIAIVGEGIAFEKSTVDGINAKTTKIKSDGSLVAKLYYTRNEYNLSYVVKNGNNTEKTYRYGELIPQPITPVKAGYTFLGWKSKEDSTEEFVFGKTMPSEDITIYGALKPNSDTKFIVEHYYQNIIGNGYSLNKMENKKGITNEEIELSTISTNIDGIKFKEGKVNGIITETSNIKGDGSLVVKLYYTRNEYKINYVVENGNNTEKTYRFGEIVEQPITPLKAGYTFSGWKSNESLTEEFIFGKTMPSENITVYGEFKPDSDTKFIVEHYYQNIIGSGYSVNKRDNKTGTTDEDINLSSFIMIVDGIAFKESTVDGNIIESTNIKGDGTLVVKLYYTRNEYKINYVVENDKNAEKTYRFGEIVEQPITLVKSGYTFSGWKSNESLTEEFIFGKTMPSENITVYGEFKPKKDTEYIVEHYKQNIVGEGYTRDSVDNLTGTTDTESTAVAKDYIGFTAKGFKQSIISGDVKTVIRIEYERNSYSVDLDAAGGIINKGNIMGYTYGVGNNLPINVTRTGYIFKGWFDESSQVTHISISDTGDKSYLAKWDPVDNTVYKVRHLREDLDARYIIEEIEIKYGTTDTETIASNRNYIGFTVANFRQENISGDGSTVIEILYSRNSYNLSWQLIGGSLSGNYTKGIVKFGEPVIQPNVEKSGYTFPGWYSDSSLINKYTIPSLMPAEDISVFGSLTANSGISYKAIHHLQNANDNEYTAYETENINGHTDELVTRSPKTYNYFDFNESVGGTLLSGNIKANGSLVLKLYYNRKTFTVNYEVDGEQYGEQSIYKYEEQVIYPLTPNKEGYFFDTWQLDEQTFTGSMPGKDIILTPTWSAGEKSYTIRFYLERLNYTNESNRWELMSRDNVSKSGTWDDTITVSPEKGYVGFSTPEEKEVTLNSGISTVDFYYTRNSYSLNWILGSGIASNDYTKIGEVRFETPIISPILIMTGYSYTWDSAIEGIMPDRELEYTANWTPNSYIVRFNEEGLGNIQVTYGETYGQLPDPSKVGHTFYGWYRDPSHGEKITEDSLVTIVTDQILYAKWSANSYGITYFNIDGGVNHGNNSYSYIFGVGMTLGDPAKTGYNFLGWYEDETLEKVITEISINSIGNMNLYAKWTPKTYGVILNANGGTIESGGVTEYTYGESVVLPTDVTREGYTFNGWYDGETKVDMILETSIGAKAYTAKWSANSYGINYFNINGAVNHGNNLDNYTYGVGMTLENPTKTGYNFLGWYEDEALEKKITEIAINSIGNMNLYAKWTPQTYVVTLNANGGTIDSGRITEYTYGESAVLPTDVTREGYKFVGWYDGETKIEGILETFIGAKSYTAKWSTNSYGITYFNINGAVNHENNSSSYIFGVGMTLGDPTKIGYNFLGWYEDEALENVITEIAINSIGNIDLYAKWTPQTYAVILNVNGGTIESGRITEYTYGVGAVLPTDVTREGYTFNGWYDGETKVDMILETSIGAKAYTAKWSANSYGINYFNINGAVNHGNNSSSYIFGVGLFLGTPTKVGHEFQGWYKDEALNNKVISISTSDMGSMDIYAKWTTKSYQVTLNTDGGILEDNITSYTYGEVMILPLSDKIIRNGYIFNGWSNGTKIVTEIPLGSTETKSYTATWSIVTYDISYELNGGTNSLDNPVSYNVISGDIILSDPNKAVHTFGGWFTDSTFATPAGNPAIVGGRTENITFYAKWVPFSYSVVFNSNDSTGTINHQTFNVGESKKLSLNIFSRDGYSFVGWSKSPNGAKDYDNGSIVSNLSLVNNGSVNLYALWTPIIYTITYNLNGGINNLNPGTYNIETQGIILKALTRDGYSFQGWYKNSNFTGNKLVQIDAGSIGNLSLYAKWIAKQNISGITTSVQTFTYDESAKMFVIKGTVVTGFKLEYKKTGDVNWSDEAIDAGKYAVKITRPTDETYNAYELVLNDVLVINRAARSMSAPNGGTASYARIIVNPVTSFLGYGHGDVEYAVSAGTTTPSTGWTTSLSTGNLSEGSYYLFARVTEGGNFLAATSGASGVKVNVGAIAEDWIVNVRIKTSNEKNSGTKGKVGLMFEYEDTNYTEDRHVMAKPKGQDFNDGYDDVYPVSNLKAPWRLRGVEIGNDKSNDKWQCDFMKFNFYKGTGSVNWTNNGNWLHIDVYTWFPDLSNNNNYLTYRPNIFKRNITSLGQFNSWDSSHALNSSDTGSITKTFDGIITDQYGTYDAYAQIDAPVMSVQTSPGYTDCFSYNGKSFTIDKAKLYKKMVANNLTTLTFKINLEFGYTNNNIFTKTVTITR